jgi:hypothetical protein
MASVGAAPALFILECCAHRFGRLFDCRPPAARTFSSSPGGAVRRVDRRSISSGRLCRGHKQCRRAPAQPQTLATLCA